MSMQPVNTVVEHLINSAPELGVRGGGAVGGGGGGGGGGG